MSRRVLPILVVLALAVLACEAIPLPALPTLTAAPASSPTPTQTSTPTPKPTPTSTPMQTPAPTPTPTPIPPQQLTIHWPEQVSAMRPVPLAVEVVPPPGVEVTTTLSAVVRHPRAGLIYEAPLLRRDDTWFEAEEPLRLPLNPPSGTYRLIVLVDSSLHAVGDRVIFFNPAPIPFHDLAPGSVDGCHEGVRLSVPLEYDQVVGDGGPWAGRRVWRFEEGVVSLWWAPGPTEALLLDNAIVMLEATHDTENPPGVTGVEPTEWLGQPAFLFRERWPGLEGGPAEALVVQGPDFWLHVLRIRATGGATIPEILYQVRATFSFDE